jgi:hypothetical protein
MDFLDLSAIRNDVLRRLVFYHRLSTCLSDDYITTILNFDAIEAVIWDHLPVRPQPGKPLSSLVPGRKPTFCLPRNGALHLASFFTPGRPKSRRAAIQDYSSATPVAARPLLFFYVYTFTNESVAFETRLRNAFTIKKTFFSFYVMYRKEGFYETAAVTSLVIWHILFMRSAFLGKTSRWLEQ